LISMGRWPHRGPDGRSMEKHSEVDDGECAQWLVSILPRPLHSVFPSTILRGVHAARPVGTRNRNTPDPSAQGPSAHPRAARVRGKRERKRKSTEAPTSARQDGITSWNTWVSSVPPPSPARVSIHPATHTSSTPAHCSCLLPSRHAAHPNRRETQPRSSTRRSRTWSKTAPGWESP